jgi:hypothetical protein
VYMNRYHHSQTIKMTNVDAEEIKQANIEMILECRKNHISNFIIKLNPKW